MVENNHLKIEYILNNFIKDYADLMNLLQQTKD